MKYFLGLDNGGTMTKAAIFSPEGEQMGTASVPTAVFAPRPGFMERDMEEMWQANCRVIRAVLEKTGISPEEIAGVGVCGHGKGLYLWGKDGRPAYRGIPSGDNRATACQMAWERDGTEARAFALSCQHVMACQPVALLAWLRDNEPGVLENTRWVFACKDYVRFRLTGEAWAERTDCSGSGLLNLHTGQYDRELLKLFGIEKIWDALPPLCGSDQVCGRVTEEAASLCGLRSGTPVVGGMFDIDACALAVGVVEESRVCMIAGTWSINEYIRREPVLDGSVRMNSFYCLPGFYLVEESSATSAGNNEWFVRKLMPEAAEAAGKAIYRANDEAVQAIPPEEFVPVFLPFLMASNVHPNARGSFVGLCASHTRDHLLRSVYEGVAFSHRYHLEKLLASRKEPPVAIRLAGGVANSPVWTQMFADIMQLPVETVQGVETGALGCAAAAACGTGTYETLEQAALHMCRVSGTVEPRPALREIYDRKYALYCKTIACLDSLWDDMQKLAE